MAKGRDTLREIGVGVTSSFDNKGFKEAVKAVDDLKKSLNKSGRTNPFQTLQKNATKFENTLKRIEKSMLRIARTKGGSLDYAISPSKTRSGGSKSAGSYSAGRSSVEAAISSLSERIKKSGTPLSKKVASDLEKVLDQIGKGNLKNAKDAFKKYRKEWETNTGFKDLTKDIGSNLNDLDESIEGLIKSFSAFERQMERFVRHMPQKQVELREDYKKTRDKFKGDLKEGRYFGSGIVSKVMAHREMRQEHGKSYNPLLGMASSAAVKAGMGAAVGTITRAIPVIGTVAGAIMTAAEITKQFRERIGKLNESFFALQASTQGISTSTTVAMVNNIKATDAMNDFAYSHRKTRDEIERLSVALGKEGFMFRDIFDTLNSQGRSLALETSINAAHIFGTSLEEAAGIVGQFRHTIGMQLDKMGSAFMRLQHDAQKSGIPIEMFRKDVMDLSMQLVKYNADFENISDAYRKFNSVVKLPIQLARQLGTQFVASFQQMETAQSAFLLRKSMQAGGRGDLIKSLKGTRDRLREKDKAGTADTKDKLTLERLEGIVSKLEKGGGIEVMDAKFIAETSGDPNVMIRGLSKTLEGRDVQVGDELVRQFMGIFGLAPELEHAVVASVRNMREIESTEAEIAKLKKGGLTKSEGDKVKSLEEKLAELKGESTRLSSEIAEGQYQQMEKAIQEQLKETRTMEQVISDSIYGAIDSLWTRMENPLHTIAGFSGGKLDKEKRVSQAKMAIDALPGQIEKKKSEVSAREKALADINDPAVYKKAETALHKARAEQAALEEGLAEAQHVVRTGGVTREESNRAGGRRGSEFVPYYPAAPHTTSTSKSSIDAHLSDAENRKVQAALAPKLLQGASPEDQAKIQEALKFMPTFMFDMNFSSDEQKKLAQILGDELQKQVIATALRVLAEEVPRVTSGT